MKNTKIRMVVDVALGAALSTLLYAVLMNVTLLLPVMMFLCAMPMMYVSCKHGIFASVVLYALSVAGWYLLSADIQTVLRMSVSYMLPGLVFGICAGKNCKWRILVAVTSAVVFLGTMADVLIVNGDGDGIRKLLTEMTTALEPAMKQVIELGNIPENIDVEAMMSQVTSGLIEAFILWLPSLVIISSVIYGYIISGFGVFFLKRAGVKKIPYVKFSKMKATNSMCLIFAILYLITSFSESTSIYMSAARNLMLMLGFAIAVCGFSFVDWGLSRKIKSGYIRAIIYAAVCLVGFMFTPMLASALLFVGFLDRILKIRPDRVTGDGKNEDKQR